MRKLRSLEGSTWVIEVIVSRVVSAFTGITITGSTVIWTTGFPKIGDPNIVA